VTNEATSSVVEASTVFQRQGAYLQPVTDSIPATSFDPEWTKGVLPQVQPIDIEAHLRDNYPQYKGAPFTQKKPWGREHILHWTPTRVYKLIEVDEGKTLSYQFHRVKNEVSTLVYGEAELFEGPFAQDYGMMLPKEQEALIRDIYQRDVAKLVKSRRLQAGDVWHNPVGKIHTIRGITNIAFFEIQTPHLDDVVRVQDDSNRTGSKP
jgi:mannose-6-phosphate isomerase